MVGTTPSPSALAKAAPRRRTQSPTNIAGSAPTAAPHATQPQGMNMAEERKPIVIHDAQGQPLAVGDSIRGTHPGTVQAPGNKPANGTITEINQQYAYVRWHDPAGPPHKAYEWMAYATLDRKRGIYILSGQTGNYDRGFENWAINKQ